MSSRPRFKLNFYIAKVSYWRLANDVFPTGRRAGPLSVGSSNPRSKSVPSHMPFLMAKVTLLNTFNRKWYISLVRNSSSLLQTFYPFLTFKIRTRMKQAIDGSVRDCFKAFFWMSKWRFTCEILYTSNLRRPSLPEWRGLLKTQKARKVLRLNSLRLKSNRNLTIIIC